MGKIIYSRCDIKGSNLRESACNVVNTMSDHPRCNEKVRLLSHKLCDRSLFFVVKNESKHIFQGKIEIDVAQTIRRVK